MSLFGSSMPKGITEKELGYALGELRNAPFGHEAEKFTDSEIERIKGMCLMAMDADSVAERQHHTGEIDANEEAQIEGQMATGGKLALSATKKARLHAVLKKYLDQNIVHGLFS